MWIHVSRNINIIVSGSIGSLSTIFINVGNKSWADAASGTLIMYDSLFLALMNLNIVIIGCMESNLKVEINNEMLDRFKGGSRGGSRGPDPLFFWSGPPPPLFFNRTPLK